MANRTVKDAHSIKGTNPQYLVEKIIRTRIYESRYWKEECFALTAALLVDKAMELKYIGGVFGGNIKPSPFLCLVLKMLQIQPEKDIIVEFIRNEDFKYVRALGATYMRLTGTSLDCFKYLEPLYYDYRKLKQMDRNGEFVVIHMDEFIDALLREERSCDIILPRLQKRHVLEDSNQLETRVSAVEEDLENMESDEEEELLKEAKRSPTPERLRLHKEPEKVKRSPSPRRRSRSHSPHRRDRVAGGGRRRSREKERDRERDRRADPRVEKRQRSRSRSPGKKEGDDRRKKSKKVKKDKHDEDKDRKRHKDHDRHERDYRDRERGDRDRDRERDRNRYRDGRDGRDGHRSGRDDRRSSRNDEIREANELRAKLGMAPLRM